MLTKEKLEKINSLYHKLLKVGFGYISNDLYQWLAFNYEQFALYNEYRLIDKGVSITGDVKLLNKNSQYRPANIISAKVVYREKGKRPIRLVTTGMRG